MYIRITSKCNMTCDHCAFSCTMDGEDMSIPTFDRAVDYCCETGNDYVTLGGGEPTIHPRFWEIFGKSLGSFEGLFIVTNGSITTTSLKLVGLANKCELFGIELSRDWYHDEINESVIKAFKDSESCGIRDVTRSHNGISEVGRAAELGIATGDHCVCDDWIIDPDGSIKFCGCDDAPIVGDV
ncbi:MAG: radical SAM protein, partial [Candidatus Thorarchaeota archaeon]